MSSCLEDGKTPYAFRLSVLPIVMRWLKHPGKTPVAVAAYNKYIFGADKPNLTSACYSFQEK
jgi:hypothetical protein